MPVKTRRDSPWDITSGIKCFCPTMSSSSDSDCDCRCQSFLVGRIKPVGVMTVPRDDYMPSEPDGPVDCCGNTKTCRTCSHTPIVTVLWVLLAAWRLEHGSGVKVWKVIGGRVIDQLLQVWPHATNGSPSDDVVHFAGQCDGAQEICRVHFEHRWRRVAGKVGQGACRPTKPETSAETGRRSVACVVWRFSDTSGQQPVNRCWVGRSSDACYVDGRTRRGTPIRTGIRAKCLTTGIGRTTYTRSLALELQHSRDEVYVDGFQTATEVQMHINCRQAQNPKQIPLAFCTGTRAKCDRGR